MKMKKIFLTSAVALALLSSCNNDYDGQDIAGTKLAVSASIDQVNTRLSDSGSEWTEGDAIGVSDNLSNPNPAAQWKHVWISSNRIIWPGSGP